MALEFTIFDAKSFGIPGPRWHAIETNHDADTMKFSSVKKAEEWFKTNGFTFKPSICCWTKKEAKQ